VRHRGHIVTNDNNKAAKHLARRLVKYHHISFVTALTSRV
jgi:hypothetical protein